MLKMMSYESSLVNKLTLHKQMYFQVRYRKDPLFSVTGAGGECLRDYWRTDKETFIRAECRRERYETLDCARSVRNVLEHSYNAVFQKYGAHPDFYKMPFSHVYRSTRLKNHFGKTIAENLLSNTYMLAPLQDFKLYRLRILDSLNDDCNLLFALALDRYCPGLLDIKFEGGRSIKMETVECARKLNARYPRVSMRTAEADFTIVNGNVPDLSELGNATLLDRHAKASDYLAELFFDPVIKERFSLYFGSEPYDKAQEALCASKFSPLSEAASVAAVGVILRCLYDTPGLPDLQAPSGQTGNLSPAALELAKIRRMLQALAVARIDIKNSGNGADFIISNNAASSSFSVFSARWWSDLDGTGRVVTGKGGVLNMHVKCIGNGVFCLRLRGIDKKNSSNQRIPLWVTYTSLLVNNIEMLKQSVDAWHDKVCELTFAVVDGQELDIIIKWLPYRYQITDLARILSILLRDKT